MGEVNCLKKEAGMKTLKDLSESFVKRIKYVVNTHFGADTNPQNEIKVAFDPYLKDKEGRKHQTQLKRAGGSTAQPKSYYVEDMSLENINIKDLLGSVETKHSLTEIFAKALLCDSELLNFKLTVAYHQKVFGASVVTEHGHEEADQIMPCMVRDSFALTPFREVTVVSPDSDSFGSLIDVVAKGVAKRLINPLVSKLTLVIGKGALTKTIDVISRVNTMGLNFARAYIGLQVFTGTVWGGKFLGVTKKHWSEAFFLAADDELLEAFSPRWRIR